MSSIEITSKIEELNFIYNLCKDNKIAYARSGVKYLVNMKSFLAYMELADGEPINATA